LGCPIRGSWRTLLSGCWPRRCWARLWASSARKRVNQPDCAPISWSRLAPLFLFLDGLSRVIQGIVTGIGFIGAGSILKLNEERDIQGLTTSAGIWMTSAIGVAVGLGSLGVAILSTFLTLIVLALVGSWEYRMEPGEAAKAKERNKRVRNQADSDEDTA
jgi:hypothetical protein